MENIFCMYCNKRISESEAQKATKDIAADVAYKDVWPHVVDWAVNYILFWHKKCEKDFRNEN